MTLAAALVDHPDELRADFQRFYGIDIDDIGRSLRVTRAASLLAGLPAYASVRIAENPKLASYDPQSLMVNMTCFLDFIAWSKTKDASRKNAKWRPRFDGNGGRQRDPETLGMSVEQLEDMLSKPRRGINE